MTKRHNIVTRCFAALALLFAYVVGTSALLVGTSTAPAQARGFGRGGGFGRGYGRGWGGRGYGYGRGWGRGYGYGVYPGVVVGPRCWWNVYGVRVCSYY